jgi:ornithine cyclodeaminase/alanine dehydrogenase-like protein (mu-crystallin family)
VGSPTTLGLLNCENPSVIVEAHRSFYKNIRVQSNGPEHALASDIVCMPTSADFEVEWIPDATHLNLFDDGVWSTSCQELARRLAFTTQGTIRQPITRLHGTLEQVISGEVSGRVGEEITAFVFRADSTVYRANGTSALTLQGK